MSEVIERHQDYILTIATVPAGGLTGVPLNLDRDAPFLMRLVRSRNLGLSGFRFTNPDQQYQSSGLRTDLIPQAPSSSFGNPQPSRGIVVYPQLVYPMGGVILVDIGNNTGSALSNVQILFRGSKLFPLGAVNSRTYPPSMSVFPTTYQIAVDNLAATGAGATVRNLQLTARSNADFVMQYGACDPFTLGVDGGEFNPFNYENLYITMRDDYQKAYSNGPIHVNDLLGQGQPVNFEQAGANDDDVLFLPGLFTPQIYIERKRSIYFDLFRNDPGGGPVNLKLRFSGLQVFTR